MSSVAESPTRLFWLIVLSVFVPPLSVLLEFGCGKLFLINLLLWLFVPFGGFIHSVYYLILQRYPREGGNYEPVQSGDIESSAGTPPNNNNGPSPNYRDSRSSIDKSGAAYASTEIVDAPESTGSTAVVESNEAIENDLITNLAPSKSDSSPTPSESVSDNAASNSTSVSTPSDVPSNLPPPYRPSDVQIFDNKVQRRGD